MERGDALAPWALGPSARSGRHWEVLAHLRDSSKRVPSFKNNEHSTLICVLKSKYNCNGEL